MSELKKLFLEELQDMYDAEHRITQALPKMIDAATCDQLKTALDTHLQETEGQIEKLDQVFESFGESPKATKCPAMVGLLSEGEDLVSKHKKSTTINAAIIAAAQKVEHYEIASYGCLQAWAAILGNSRAEELIGEIIDQEKNADRTLNDLSTTKNEEALEEVAPGELDR